MHFTMWMPFQGALVEQATFRKLPRSKEKAAKMLVLSHSTSYNTSNTCLHYEVFFR